MYKEILQNFINKRKFKIWVSLLCQANLADTWTSAVIRICRLHEIIYNDKHLSFQCWLSRDGSVSIYIHHLQIPATEMLKDWKDTLMMIKQVGEGLVTWLNT